MPKVEVSIADILEYIGNRVRPLIEGEAVFKAGHIILCGVNVEQNHVVKSLCLQTSALGQPPHEISVIPNEDNMFKCECTCKAGLSGYCKHIIGTLIYMNRNEDLEYVSCTDLTQQWGKQKKGVQDMYSAKPLSEFCHPIIKRKKLDIQSNELLNKQNFKILSAASGKSSIAIFIGRTLVDKMPVDHNEATCSNITNYWDNNLVAFNIKERSTSTEFTFLIKKMIENAANSQFLRDLSDINSELIDLRPCCKAELESLKSTDVMKVALKYSQGSEKWKKERQLRITGSNCYSIFTYKKDTWENKSLSFFFPKGFSNKFTEHGLKYESEALKLFKMNNNGYHVVQTNLFVSQQFPWLGFSPDAIIFQDGKPWKLIEIKCPYMGKFNGSEEFLESCDFLTNNGSEVKLKSKHAYYGQVQLGMALLNLRETHFLVYSSFSHSYVEVKVQFDQMFSSNLIRTISKKYFKSMLHYYCINKSNN